MTDYREEKLADARPEMERMAPLQWAEMAQGFEEFVGAPRWDVYLRAEAVGAAFLVTARQDGRLVGYFGMVVHPHLSMENTLAATSTPYWVEPGRYRGLILRRLIETAMAIARQRTVKVVAIRTHVWASAGPILEAMRFRPVETSYMLSLGEPTCPTSELAS